MEEELKRALERIATFEGLQSSAESSRVQIEKELHEMREQHELLVEEFSSLQTEHAMCRQQEEALVRAQKQTAELMQRLKTEQRRSEELAESSRRYENEVIQLKKEKDVVAQFNAMLVDPSYGKLSILLEEKAQVLWDIMCKLFIMDSWRTKNSNCKINANICKTRNSIFSKLYVSPYYFTPSDIIISLYHTLQLQKT